MPDGPLIDGSTGATLVKATRVGEVLSDLPVGRYTVTVKAVGADGSKTALKVSMDYTDENPTESASLLFEGLRDVRAQRHVREDHRLARAVNEGCPQIRETLTRALVGPGQVAARHWHPALTVRPARGFRCRRR